MEECKLFNKEMSAQMSIQQNSYNFKSFQLNTFRLKIVSKGAWPLTNSITRQQL